MEARSALGASFRKIIHTRLLGNSYNSIILNLENDNYFQDHFPLPDLTTGCAIRELIVQRDSSRNFVLNRQECQLVINRLCVD